MCGIVGGLAFQSAWPMLKTAMPGMADALWHRGPDDGAVWLDESARVALGHRRLSILDLSPAGHQPMESACGRFVIVFNGEIYNHLELRREMERLTPARALPREGGGGDLTAGLSPAGAPGGMAWRGHSDTETLLAAFSRWGVRKALEKAFGMFALALWDRETRTLTLARDRIGEKPLFYGWQRGVFLFASELKALRAHPAFQAKVDRAALTLLLRHNYIPAPYSIYEGICKLRPGTYFQLALDSDPCRSRILPEPQSYWSVRQAVEIGQGNPFVGSHSEALEALEKLLLDAVRQQMVADVPLGAFLSGGVDSSTVVALMQAQSTRPVKTFSIGFNEVGYDEAAHAKAVARHLGTDHTEIYVSPREAMDVIPRLPTIYDEPFADSSQIPTFLVSELARRHVTVSLSGDAGDELFGGYSRYRLVDKIWRLISCLPYVVRKCLAKGISTLPVEGWDLFARPIVHMLPHRDRNVGDKAHKAAELFDCEDGLALYRRMVTHWPSQTSVVMGVAEPPSYWHDANRWPPLGSLYEAMMAADMVTYLPDDILVKVDRAAMAVSLESRVPLLDHRVVEFAWRLPLSLKIRDGQSKWILRQVLYKYVPRELVERPKMGFGVPIGVWLRGPLRDWAEVLFDEGRLRREGFFHADPIRQKWREHLSGQRNWQYHLWDVLMFQAWLESTHMV